MNQAANIQDNIVEKSLVIFGAIIVITGLSFFAAEYYQVSLPILVFPALMFFLFYPKLAIYALIFSIYINFRILSSPPLLLVDLFALLLLASFILGFLARTKISIGLPFISLNYFFLFFALIITSIYAEIPGLVYTPMARIVFQLIL
ncbi:MAG: hypothetical protein ABIJ45_06430, partial [Candidatus Zixiibacteriota bacterium]